MNSNAAPAIGGKTTMAARKKTVAAVIGLAATIWFVLLSGWLGVVPGTVIVKRQNVLFSSDAALWLGKVVGDTPPFLDPIHPAAVALWRPPNLAIFQLLKLFMPADGAAILAARILVALIAGTGVAFLAYLALYLGLGPAQMAFLFAMYLLFTSSSTICLPEHFASSIGLLSIAFVVPIVASSRRVRIATLSAMVLLCGATTVTNFLYPLAALWQYAFKTMRARLTLLAVAIPVCLGVGYVAFLKSHALHRYIVFYANFRLIRHPLRAAVYAFHILVAPVVGPHPHMFTMPGWFMVTYEPVELSSYFGVPAVGAIFWLALFGICLYQAYKSPETRTYLWLPLGWIVFSVLFHNVWGDEVFLYAPHWSWALMAVVILGARRLSVKAIAALTLPLMACQIYSLVAIKTALMSITQ